MSALHVFDDLPAGEVPETAGALLDGLPGPSVFRRSGRDSSRVRVVAGLLHGNEPSGLFAIHRALRDPEPPAVDVVFFLGAVEAARSEPRHTHRMLPGRRDLNRCFALPPTDVDTRIANAARLALSERRPEAALDLHNNSGDNPAYAVALGVDAPRLALTRLFARHVIHTHYRMGTLMEVFEPLCPTVTIEAGRAGEPAADELAARGVARFLAARDLAALPAEPPVQVLEGAVRVELGPELTVAFDHDHATADVLLAPDFDRHNFQSLPAGSNVGRVRKGGGWPLVAIDAAGRDRAHDLFKLDQGALYTRVAMTPVMITTQPAIARSDCLFYAVAPGIRPSH